MLFPPIVLSHKLLCTAEFERLASDCLRLFLSWYCDGNLPSRLRNESLADHQLVLVVDSLCLHGFRFFNEISYTI